MKYRILLSGVCILFFLFTTAQKNPNKAFAVVSNEFGKAGWMNIQEIDLSTGQVIRTIFDKDNTSFVLTDATTKKKIINDQLTTQWNNRASGLSITNIAQKINAPLPADGPKAEIIKTYSKITEAATKNKTIYNKEIRYTRKIARYDSPTASTVAAMAYDRRHNQLFFTPMRFGELRWIDLDEKGNALNVFCLTGKALFPSELQDEANHITRMVIAADGYGYGLSNDSKHFFRFTTGKKIQVTDLGELKDDHANTGESIQARNNWGGDMIADGAGNLYIITANRTVFKINIQKQSSAYIGAILGLPVNYTTNGAAVDMDGNLIVSSANSNEGYFKVNLETLKAEKQETNNPVLSCSDLATGFLAFNTAVAETNKIFERKIDLQQVIVYPNPVTRGYFKVDFANYEAGQYDIQLADLNGKLISQKRVKVGIKSQTENFTMMSGLAKGVYLVKVLNTSKKIISSGKILLQ